MSFRFICSCSWCFWCSSSAFHYPTYSPSVCMMGVCCSADVLAFWLKSRLLAFTATYKNGRRTWREEVGSSWIERKIFIHFRLSLGRHRRTPNTQPHMAAIMSMHASQLPSQLPSQSAIHLTIPSFTHHTPPQGTHEYKLNHRKFLCICRHCQLFWTFLQPYYYIQWHWRIVQNIHSHSSSVYSLVSLFRDCRCVIHISHNVQHRIKVDTVGNV